MAVNRADFIRWIRGATHDEARAFSVAHFPDFRPVWRSAVTGAVEPESFAAKLLADVEAHARGLGGVQRYVVQAYIGDSAQHAREYTLLFNFRESGEDDREPTFERIFEALIDRRISPLRARIAELETKLAARSNGDEG
jgi:hypothetical protein